MRVVKAPAVYDGTNEQQFRSSAEQADDQNVKKGTDIYMRGGRSGSRNPRIIFYDDDGTAWVLGVSTVGTTTWTLL